MRILFCLALVATACRSGSGLPGDTGGSNGSGGSNGGSSGGTSGTSTGGSNGGSTGGTTGGDRRCQSYRDARSCAADPECVVSGCPDCDGGTSFLGCYHKDSPPPPIGCPAIACASCWGISDPDLCAATGCRADYCDDCGAKSFVQCSETFDPPSPCPARPCTLGCEDIFDGASCDARSDCHAVYFDQGTCDCASPGCCTLFDYCASGPAICKGSVTCRRATPVCEGDYVVSYQGSCYEGCVRASKCP